MTPPAPLRATDRFGRAAAMSWALLLVPSPALAADSVAATAVRLDGGAVVGRLESFEGSSARIEPDDAPGRPVDLPAGDLLSLDLPERAPSSLPPAVLEFANGDRIAVEIGGIEDDVLSATFGDAPLAVPLDTLRGIAFDAADAADGIASLFLRERGDDLVVLTNGDRLAGQFVGLSGAELRFEAAGRETRVARERVTAVAFSPELAVPATVGGPRQIVQSARGWLTVRELRRDADGSWRGTTAFGEGVVWPSDGVARIRFAGGRAEPLSEVEPAGVEFVPYLDRVWPVRRDRSVAGEPLAAGGATFPKGLGMHSRCRVTYPLDGRYERFRAVVGLAPSAGRIGSAEFAVEVDGREVYRSGPVTAADAIPVGLELGGAETLVLTVDYGRNGDVLDRANWCDAVLIERGTPVER